MPQTVTVSAVYDSTDSSDTPLTITHSVGGTESYASIVDVTYPLTLVDDDPTNVTMTGAGVRTSASGTEISNVMVEGDSTRVDRSLTISLGHALEADEYVRVPLYLEASGHRQNPDVECDLQEFWNSLDPRPDYAACYAVSSIRGPRYSANLSWPVHLNDFEMNATGGGVTAAAVLAAWYGITDDEAAPAVEGNFVPASWPLLPSGLVAGDTFRLLYVTSGTKGAIFSLSEFTAHVRAEITGDRLVNGGVTDMVPYADSFFPVISN